MTKKLEENDVLIDFNITKEELEIIDGALDLLLLNTETMNNAMPNGELAPFYDTVEELSSKWKDYVISLETSSQKYH